MTSLTFLIDEVAGANAQAEITLQEVTPNQIQVTVRVIEGVAKADITGFFFDVANNNVNGLSVPINNTVVTATNFQVNNVLQVGSSNIAGNGISAFDAGIAIGTTGASDYIKTATFTLTGTTLSNLSGQRFGIRLQSVGSPTSSKTSKLVGTAPNLPPVTIGDRVFLDLNANGIQDTGEIGLANVTVKLLDATGTQVAVTTTDANGLYSFTANPGTYKVQVVAGNGFSYSLQNAGSNDTLDSDVDANGQSALFTLTSGQSDNSIDAGLLNIDLAVAKSFLNLDKFLLDNDGNLEFETVQVAEPQQNAPISFQIQVTNNGQTKANNVKVTDLVDSRLLVNTITVDNPSSLVANNSSGQHIDLIIALNPGETRTITVTTQVNFSTTDNLLPLDVQHILGSDNPLLNEYHNIKLAGTIYTSETGAVKAANSTLIEFNPFAPVANTATATILDTGAADANSSNNSGTDTFRFLRLLLEGKLNDGVTPVTALSLGPVSFDVDPTISVPVYIRQNSKFLGPGDVGEGTSQNYWDESNFSLVDAFENASDLSLAFELFKELIAQGTYSIGRFEEQNPKNSAEISSITIERILDQGTPQPISAIQTLDIAASGVVLSDAPTISLTADSNLQAQLDDRPSPTTLTGYSITIPGSSLTSTFTTQLSNLTTFFTDNNFIKEFIVASTVKSLVFGGNTTKVTLDASSFNFASFNTKLIVSFDGSNLEDGDTITGTSRGDLIRGLSGNDELTGGNGNDTLEGGAGMDTLYGEVGNDRLLGGSEDDILVGGSGNDLLRGEAGADTFVFGINSGNDTVTFWESIDKIDLTQFTEPDAISISDLDTNTSGTSADRIDANDAFVTLQNSNLVLNLTSFSGGTITFTGISSIATSAFIF